MYAATWNEATRMVDVSYMAETESYLTVIARLSTGARFTHPIVAPLASSLRTWKLLSRRTSERDIAVPRLPEYTTWIRKPQ